VQYEAASAAARSPGPRRSLSDGGRPLTGSTIGAAPSSARNPTLSLVFVATDAQWWRRDGTIGVMVGGP
jgi:hypothetical protein